MDKTTALEKLQRQLDRASTVERGEPFTTWYRNTQLTIEHVFGSDTRHIKDFLAVNYLPGAYNMARAEEAHDRAFRAGITTAKAVLASMLDEVREYWSDAGAEGAISLGPIARVERICQRFHLVARQLRTRHGDRPTIDVADEYDVQDLIHGLLRVDFSDVRAEEWCPSYAGKNARMDFLLKNEQIVLELKKTRRGLKTSDIGDQLIVDVARYQGHPNCRRMICFVYDPEGLIGNPAELERDLSKKHGDLDVQVVVAPKGV